MPVYYNPYLKDYDQIKKDKESEQERMVRMEKALLEIAEELKSIRTKVESMENKEDK